MKRPVSLKSSSGEVIFSESSVEVPESWSPFATAILASKYFRKNLQKPKMREKSLRQVVKRIADAITQAGIKNKTMTKKEAKVFHAELSFLLTEQYAAFNSPVWFNVGLYEAYGLKGGPGQFAWEKTSVKEVKHAYVRPQASACFIQSIEDDLMAIFELVKTEAKLFKYGSGTGTNFSPLRAKQESLSSGGKSSGLISFLEVFDKAAGATKSGGTTRRAAKMVCLDADHPEIKDFIQWKGKEEEKARALAASGYGMGLESESYRSVSGQNANLSVRLQDKFFAAVEKNQEWQTRFRSSKKICESFPAKELLQEISEAIWKCADPGVQFHDTIQAWHTCKADGVIHASNPCSEYMFLDDSACNLASLNLLKFLREDNTFDTESYKRAIWVMFTAQDILVSHASYPTKKIAENSIRYRPLGLGYANLGALCMSLALPYDSQEARCLCASLTALLQGEAYSCSANLAKRLKPFPAFAKNKKSMLAILDKHRKAIKKIPESKRFAPLKAAAIQSLEQAYALGKRHGLRNAQATVIAPTGTIGLLMDCDTTGIEPDFSLVKTKTMVGGSETTIVNQSVARALKTLGYSEESRDKIQKHILAGEALENCPFLQREHLPIFDCALPSGKGSRFLSPEAHLKMMAAAQPFLSGAISKTVNLPENIRVEEISSLIQSAWKMGLKAVAFYRNRSKLFQPLKQKEENPLCPHCQSPTVLKAGCYLCENCGHSLSCA